MQSSVINKPSELPDQWGEMRFQHLGNLQNANTADSMLMGVATKDLFVEKFYFTASALMSGVGATATAEFIPVLCYDTNLGADGWPTDDSTTMVILTDVANLTPASYDLSDDSGGANDNGANVQVVHDIPLKSTQGDRKIPAGAAVVIKLYDTNSGALIDDSAVGNYALSQPQGFIRYTTRAH